MLELAEYFRQRARATGGIRMSYDFPSSNCSQIVSVSLAPHLRVTDEDFKAAKVFTRINAADADGWREIRVGFHYYNNREDIDRFFEVINQNRDK